jgi:hypothetical protein
MKMAMIVIDQSKREELEVFLNHSGVVGYTEVSHAAGFGTSEPRLGSGAFPKTSALVFTMLNEEALERLQEGIGVFCASCGEKIKMFTWEAEQIR